MMIVNPSHFLPHAGATFSRCGVSNSPNGEAKSAIGEKT